MTSSASASSTATTRQVTVRRVLQFAALIGVYTSIVYFAAGRLDWLWAWVFLAAYLLLMSLVAVFFLPRHRDLVDERSHVAENTKTWDRYLSLAPGVVGPAAILIVSGLDARFEWTRGATLWTHLAGLGFMMIGYGLIYWAMASNRFFSSVARIQTDRGQQVETGGPYRIVRHPGYFGMCLFEITLPLIFGSWWAFIPAGLTAGAVVLRTALEDRMLQAELPRYTDYAQNVRYRLIPGIW